MPIRFSHLKYGQPLAVDASHFPRWTGIVPDGEPHTLDFSEVMLVASGRATLFFDERPMRVCGPAVLLTPPALVRRIELIEPLNLELVVFTPGGDAHQQRLSRHSAGAFSLRADALVSLNDIARQMRRELFALRHDSTAMLDALLQQLLISLGRACAQAPTAAIPRLLRRFDALLDEHFDERHDVAWYAGALGVSADHLSAIARAHRGQSAKSLIDRRVCAEAAQLLRSTTLPVAEIGSRVGCHEASDFSRLFRRVVGRSPGSLRRS